MDHDHMSGMDMTTTATATATAAMPSSTGMSHSMSMGGDCKISMLWNWYTVDSCFLARSWHITSKGMFAGSCIGVILLVILFYFLRRVGKEYERRYIYPRYNNLATPTVAKPTTRATITHRLVSAVLHLLQFAIAYFMMLLAMYYNGYIIISLFIGAFIGYLIFGIETDGRNGQDDVTGCCG